uniref:TRP C-terminal domain-containing protein n=1 Tax=Amphimedon queenslandica TaxID=400682 RepID=A0A1X7UGD7_AMPQE
MACCKQMLYKLLLTVILVSLNVSGSDECVYLTNSTSLVYHLCGKGRSLLQPGTHLCLLANISYDLNMANSSFCLVSGVSNITILSASTNVPATITCSEPTGLGFYNSSGLRIENVNIHQCGGTMPSVAWLYPSHDNSFYFPKGQSSTLLFSHSADVLLQNVSISNFYGYGIVYINHYKSLAVISVKIYSSVYCDIDTNCAGGGTGLLLYFSNYTTNEPVTAIISHIDLQGNDNTDINRPLSSSSYPKAVNSFASCTAVLFSEGNYQASIFFEKSVWDGCYHSLYNIAIIARDAPIGRTTVAFENVTFTENKLIDSKVGVIGCIVGSRYKRNEIGIKKKWSFLSIKNSLFQFHYDALSKQLADTTYDHIFFHVIVDSNIEAYVSISLQNIYCKRSHFGYRSSIIFAKVTENGKNQQKNLLLELKSFTVGTTNWKLVPKRVDNIGKMVFVNIANVTIYGNNIMKYITGSVILACNSDIYLYGDILFENNRATNGGAIRLDQSSHMFLLEPLNAVFIRNKAFSYGGAIYSYVERNLPLSNSLCAIQIYSNKTNASDINIKLHFINNTAGLAGNSMYVSPSYDCQQLNSPFNTSVLYNALTYFTNSNWTTNEIASVAVKTQLCSISGVNKVKTSYNFYPGQTLTIGLRTVDLNNISSYAQVLTTLTRILKTSFLKYNMDISNELNPKHRTQVVYSNSCTPLQFQILPAVNNTERDISLRFAVFGYFSVAFVKLEQLNCPLGFVYNNKTKRCTCSSFLKALGITQCKIDNTKVLIPQASWLGLVHTKNQSKLEYCPHCPPGYCRTDTWNINVTQIDDICMSNHAGILCGQCKEGYSKVLFSYDCHYCNNDIENVGLLAVIVVTSILYVVLLFCFKFTINKGTIGGLVLWFDVVSLTPSFTLLVTHKNIFRYFIYGISFTIYSLQIPLCVWNGFNAMDTMFIEYSFSFYLWLLVIIIILISRCSTKVSNLTVGSSVQVLMTLMFISFSNLLSLSLNVLTPARIHQLSPDGSTSSRLVWFTDGSVLYGRDPVHIILICISIAVIIFFVVPFILLGLFGVKLFRFRCMAMYLRPFIEALHGPYKDKHRYWFGLMLIIRTLVHIISASLDSNNTTLLLLIFTVVTGFYVLGLCLVKPYKNKIHNGLEILFGIILLANLIVSSSASSLSAIETVASVSISCGGVLCCIILGYHICIGLNQNRRIRKLLKQKCCNFYKKDDLYESLPPLIEENREEKDY